MRPDRWIGTIDGVREGGVRIEPHIGRRSPSHGQVIQGLVIGHARIPDLSVALPRTINGEVVHQGDLLLFVLVEEQAVDVVLGSRSIGRGSEGQRP